MLLLIDNYDSFAINLARYFERLGQPCVVVRNDQIDVEQVRRMQPGALVLSPGPCTPREAGSSLELVRQLHGELPMLGVCLGHQTIAAALGAQIVRAIQPIHGQPGRVFHDGRGIFAEMPNPLTAGRYHSLVVDRETLPECLEVSAHGEEGAVMALRHRRLPLVGLQFHPESVLTEAGYPLLARFLEMAGLPIASQQPTLSDELEPGRESFAPQPQTPITF